LSLAWKLLWLETDRYPILLGFLRACGVSEGSISDWASLWGRLLPPDPPAQATPPRPRSREAPVWHDDARAFLALMRNGWTWREPTGWRPRPHRPEASPDGSS
jgi:hypothetical protein